MNKKILFGSIFAVLMLTTLSLSIIAMGGTTQTTQLNNPQTKGTLTGTIIVHCIQKNPIGQFPLALARVACMDLNTGAVRYTISGLFGFCTFRLLPLHHNYKVSLATYPSVYETVHNLQNTASVDLILFT